MSCVLIVQLQAVRSESVMYVRVILLEVASEFWEGSVSNQNKFRSHSGARSVLKKKTRLEQQRALNEAERKGVHKGAVKCARPECATGHFDLKWSAHDGDNLRRDEKRKVPRVCERGSHAERFEDIHM